MDTKHERLKNLLVEWRADARNAEEVHAAAEELLALYGVRDLPESDPDSIADEVLVSLDMLNHQWIVPDDIPEVLEFLCTPAGRELEGWSRWRRYWDGVDLDQRKNRLQSVRGYAV